MSGEKQSTITEEEFKEEADKLETRGTAIGTIITKLQSNPDLLSKINDLLSEKDEPFGEKVFELIKEHYPEEAKQIDASIAIPIGRCVEHLLSFNVNQKHQLDDRFEVDYLKRYLKTFAKPFDVDRAYGECCKIWKSMEDDIRFLQTNKKAFFEFEKMLKDSFKIAKENSDETNEIEDWRSETHKMFQRGLNNIDKLNTSKHRKYEKFPSVDYARRIVGVWDDYIANRESYLDTKAFAKVVDELATIHRQLGVDDRKGDKRLIPIVNVLHYLCDASEFQKSLLLGTTSEDQESPIEAYFKMLDKHVDSIKQYTEEPEDDYTGE